MEVHTVWVKDFWGDEFHGWRCERIVLVFGKKS